MEWAFSPIILQRSKRHYGFKLQAKGRPFQKSPAVQLYVFIDSKNSVRALMDVVIWLRSLGLGKYEAVFRENEIDETVLPSLTDEHLKELGVTALGHRVKLLDAIAALRSDTSAQGTSNDLKTAPAAQSVRPEDRAERRQVTV